MPRSVTNRRFVVAAILIMLAFLPPIVEVWSSSSRPFLMVDYFGKPTAEIDVPSIAWAKSIEYVWDLYRKGSWVLGLVGGLIAIHDYLKTRRASRHDGLGIAVILIMLAILPQVVHVVHVYPGIMYNDVWPIDQHSVQVYTRAGLLYQSDVASIERTKELAAAWQSYRQCWWVFAAIAACLVIREFLRTPRSFGRDDESSSVAASPGEL